VDLFATPGIEGDIGACQPTNPYGAPFNERQGDGKLIAPEEALGSVNRV